MSPQLLARERYTTKSDIWSIGIIFYEMCFGKVPWVAKDPQSYLKNILSTPPPIDRKINNISFEAEDFIVHCLQIKESDRIGWEEMFSHALVNSLNESNELEAVAEFSKEENGLDSKLRTYSLKSVSSPTKFKLAKGNLNAGKFSLKPSDLNIQQFSPSKMLNSLGKHAMDKKFFESKSGQSPENSIQINGLGNQLGTQFNKSFKNNEAGDKNEQVLVIKGGATRTNAAKKVAALNEDIYNDSNSPDSRLQVMSYEFKGNFDLRELEIVISNSRAIALKFWEFLTTLEDSPNICKLGATDKYKANLLLVKFLSLFFEMLLGTCKSIINSSAVKMLEDPAQLKKVCRMLEFIEKDYTIIKEMDLNNRRNLLILGNDPLIEEKEKDLLIKFFSKICASINFKEIEIELIKVLAKICSVFRDLIVKKKLDAVLKHPKKKSYLNLFHGSSLFFQGTLFSYMSNWNPELKFELDPQDLQVEAFEESVILELFRESYKKVMKNIEGANP